MKFSRIDKMFVDRDKVFERGGAIAPKQVRSRDSMWIRRRGLTLSSACGTHSGRDSGSLLPWRSTCGDTTGCGRRTVSWHGLAWNSPLGMRYGKARPSGLSRSSMFSQRRTACCSVMQMPPLRAARYVRWLDCARGSCRLASPFARTAAQSPGCSFGSSSCGVRAVLGLCGDYDGGWAAHRDAVALASRSRG